MTKFLAIAATAFALWLVQAFASTEKEKTILCSDRRPQIVRVVLGRVTVLNFPFRPKEVIPGGQAFDFKQMKDDLVIVALHAGAHTNAVVYLEDRKCAFDLIVTKEKGDDILIVKDPKDSNYEVKFHD
jgi:hypothetical protein